MAAERAAEVAEADSESALAAAVASKTYADERDAEARQAQAERDLAKSEADAALAAKGEAMRLVEFHKSMREATERSLDDHRAQAAQAGTLGLQLEELKVREAAARELAAHAHHEREEQRAAAAQAKLEKEEFQLAHAKAQV